MKTQNIINEVERWGCCNVSGYEETPVIVNLIGTGDYILETVPSASCGTLTIIAKAKHDCFKIVNLESKP